MSLTGAPSSLDNNQVERELVQQLLQEQAINQTELERFVRTYKKSPKDRLKVGYIKEKKSAIQEQWAEIEKIHRKLLHVYSDEFKNSKYFANDVYSDMDDIYFQTCGLMNDQLAALEPKQDPPIESISHTNSSFALKDSTGLKLPRINIPNFSGNYADWPSFHDLFTAIVHNSTQISKVQKLHYLRSSVSGEAENLIKHLHLTDNNYLAAWEILRRRYQNNRLLVSTQLTVLSSLPTHTNESAHTLKKMLDTINEVLEALKGLKVETKNWDPLLIHSLTHKLNKETLTHWEMNLSGRTDPNALPTIEEFKDFLEKRFRTLESIKGNHNKPERYENMKVHITQNKMNDIHNLSCPLCKRNHILRDCQQFISLKPFARYQFIKEQSRCFNCFSKSHLTVNCPNPFCCQKCRKRHNTMLHLEFNSSQRKNHPQTTTTPRRNNTFMNRPNPNTPCQNTPVPPLNQSRPHVNNTSQIQNLFVERTTPKTVLLATAVINVYSDKCGVMKLRALLDQGSQASFITEAGAQLLQAKRKPTTIMVTGIGSTETETARSIVELKIGPHFMKKEQFQINALVIKKITGLTPVSTIHAESWNHLKGLQLADPQYFNPGQIDVLLGADIYSALIENGLIKGPEGTPIAQQTTLGWILSGPIKQQVSISTISLICEVDTNTLLRQFWEIEEIHEKKFHTEADMTCEEIYTTTHKRNKDGRYEVVLPFKSYPNPPKLGESKSVAIKRFLNVERKLRTNTMLRKEYITFMREYISLGHMKRISCTDTTLIQPNYLPHHCVIKADSSTTKVRVVFDASAKTTNGSSLNDTLLAGPTIQEDLTIILLKWRRHKIAFTADIEKMYRQIRVKEDDTDYQRILWRECESEPIEEYRLLTVTYGTTCAPFLAIRTLQQLATDESKDFEAASKVILKDSYVDDILSGADTINEALSLQQQLRELLRRGGLNLRKWTSNAKELLTYLPEEDRELKPLMSMDVNTTIKTLGIHWNPINDTLTFKIRSNAKGVKTKRELLSEIAKLFDPLGWIAPIIVKAKIMMQQLWLLATGWDDPLPDEIIQQWEMFHHELQNIKNINIPRWIKTYTTSEYEIHGFCDASIQAYAAVIYLRIKNGHESGCFLITAKTRIAPIKQISLPKLELCGAFLLSKLIHQIQPALPCRPHNTFLWTDSTIVLSWLQGHPSKWKTFIANRVSDIHEKTNGCYWKYVPTAENPADCASRGQPVPKLITNKLWWSGPNWLKQDNTNWPEYPKGIQETKLERKRNVHAVNTTYCTEVELLERFSSWSKLLKITALCQRFINNCKPKNVKRTGYITWPEINNAKIRIINIAQRNMFQKELSALRTEQPLPKDSAIHNLNPFMDSDNILRVGGRLRNSTLPYNEKFPIIVAAKCPTTRLIIDNAHKLTLHGGPQLTLATSRKEFWIVNAKTVIRQHIHRCITCWKHKCTTQQQLMGDLPKHRITQSRPFQHCGIDFCGPMLIKESKCRGRVKTSKGYICLFICLATKAIHLEMVSDLSAEAFNAAFRRFSSRRGVPKNAYTDCGTNFVGASRKLAKIKFQQQWGLTDDVYAALEQGGTQWHFIPPGSPHFGGLWESGVKSTKYHMKRVIGNTLLTFEEMSTVIVQIEASLNSRPLCPISNDPDDISILTPGHFLIGSAIIAPPEDNLLDVKMTSVNRWKQLQHMHQSFWTKWHNEYLHRLQQRPKWTHREPNVKIGELVLVKEERLPPTRWLLGRITDVHPGNDGLVRVVTIKTKDSILKRAITKICPLPIDNDFGTKPNPQE